ncbi:MAG: glycosyltransferase, partial [Chloroflexota bacterium]|nr:glycosyltransferase [Chloroflexota bacterium]
RYAFIAANAAPGTRVVATAHSFMRVPARAAILQRLAMSSVDRVIAVSAYVARGFAEHLKLPARRIRVVRNAVDQAPFRAARPADLLAQLRRHQHVPIVLSVARLDEGKGIEHLLQAAVEVKEAVFVLAGDGPLRPEFERDAAAHGLRDRAIFLGERSDIAALLAGCDVFVLPSLNEGLPLTVLEAMAAERPVVSTDVGGIPEVVVDGRTGILVRPADPGRLAQAVRELLQNPARARKLAAAGRLRGEREFTMEKMIGGVASVYAEVLAPTRSCARR